MKLYPSQIVKHYEVSRNTVYRDISKGRITADDNGKGRTLIDVSELDRVYKKRQLDETLQSVSHEQADTPKNDGFLNVLQREIELLREKVEGLETDKEDLKGERDRLLKLVEEQAVNIRLLTDQRTPERPKGFWRWLVGKS